MLSVEEMKEVLTKPKNALCKQYKQLFTASHTDFKTTPDALQEVAVAACKRNSGARGLRSILELLLQDALYEASPLSSRLMLMCQSPNNKKRHFLLASAVLMKLYVAE